MNTKTKLALLFLIAGLLGIYGIVMLRPMVDNGVLTVNYGIVEKKSLQYLVNATCYVATGYKTYSGKYPTEEMVAIRFNSAIVKNMGLKIGDKIYIEGMGVKFVEDRLPDYQKADLDIFFLSRGECLGWGRKNLIIEKL